MMWTTAIFEKEVQDNVLSGQGRAGNSDKKNLRIGAAVVSL